MKKFGILKLLFPLLLLNFSYATTLKEAVENALINNPEVMSIHKNSEAYKLYVDEEEASYYPTINFDSYLENKKATKTPETGSKTNTIQNGYNSQLTLEQVIFDGGLTPARVDEAKHDYQKTKLANITKIENVIFEVTQSYLDLVKYKELLILSENNIRIHENYLETAKQSAEVSGEALDKIQVESKLYLATSKYFQQKNDKEVSLHSFKKLVGLDPSGQICKPLINFSLVPSDIDDAVTLGIKNSFTILEQIEEIKVKRAILSQENSRFLPSLKFQLKEEWDDDLDIAKTNTKTHSARFTLNYNLFNGNKDQATQQRERIFLQESQKKLDDTSNRVEEEMRNAYSTYYNSLNKINYLKLYVEKNKEILEVYKEQFLGGTRTFIDILNTEAELFSAKTQLIEEEHSLLRTYHEILLVLSKLSETVVMSENQLCQEMIVDINPESLESITKKSDDADLKELDSLLSDDMDKKEKTDESLGIEDTQKTKEPIVDNEQLVKDLLNEILKDVYNLDTIENNLFEDKEIDFEKENELPEKSIIKETIETLEEPNIPIEKEIKKDKIKTERLSDEINPQEEEIKKEVEIKAQDVKEYDTKIEENIIPNEKIDSIKETKSNAEETKEVKVFKNIIFSNKKLKEEFLNNNSLKYTITLTSSPNFEEAKWFRYKYKVNNDTIVYKFRNKVKITYGIFNTSNEAGIAIGNFDEALKKHRPFVNKINTHQKLYKKYNQSREE